MIFIPFLILCIFYFFYSIKNNKKFGIISYLIFIYIVMSVCAIVAYYTDIATPVIPFKLTPILYLCFTMILALYSLSGFRDDKFRIIYIENYFLLKWFEYFLIVGGIFSFFYYLPLAVNALSGDIRLNRIYGTNNERMREFGVINSIATMFANLFVIMIICSLIEFSLDGKGSKKRAIFLLLASLSFIIHILAFVGRDGFIYYTISIIFVFLLMKDFLSIRKKKVFIKVIFYISIISFVPFILITFSRFGDLNESLTSMINYGGQQIANFNDRYIINPTPRKGGANFKNFLMFFEKIGFNIKPNYSNDYSIFYYSQFGAVPWVFSTFIGSFLSDFGRFGTLALMCVIVILGRISTYRLSMSHTFSFSKLMIFTLLFQIVSWGVFYFRHASLNRIIFVMILIAFVFYLMRSRADSIKIRKIYESK